MSAGGPDADRLASALIDAASRAVDRGMRREASQLLDEILEQIPDHPGALQLRDAIGDDVHASQGHGRRYLTVLFADLAGSTALSGELDPEDYVRVIAAFREVVRSAVANHAGHLDQFQGDGAVVYFGFPTADEDDQCRAVRAALEITDGTAKAGEELGQPLHARVGVHVGQTVMTDSGLGIRDQDAAIGFSANVASRVQTAVDSGEVAVSSAVVPFIAHEFAVEPVTHPPLRGVSAEIGVHLVVGSLDPRGESSHDRHDLALVGRDAESADLDRRFRRAAGPDGPGEFVIVCGEAGIGKTHLIEQLVPEVLRSDATLVRVDCTRTQSHVALGAVCVGIERALVDREDYGDSERTRAELDHRLRRVGLPDHAMAVLEWLLGIELAGSSANLLPDRRREAVLDTLVDWVGAEAAHSGIVILIDDLHWADELTVELIDRLTTSELPSGAFVVLTTRPGDTGTQRGGDESLIELAPLADEATRALIIQALGDRELDPGGIDELVDRSEGIPLFAEHLALATHSPGTTDAAAVPATLEQLLQIRLDRTGPGRSVAEVASVIGREFSLDALRLVFGATGEPHGSLTDGLRALTGAGLVEGLPGGRFRFGHALVRDAAYDLQLHSALAGRHRAVARAIQTLDGSSASPEALAHHFECAGEHRSSAQASLRAAERSVAIADWSKAVEALERALTNIEAERSAGNEDADLDRIELACQMQIASASVSSASYMQDRADTAYTRALDLCDSLEQSEAGGRSFDPQLLVALGGLWAKEIVSGSLPAARAISDRLETVVATRVLDDLTFDLSLYVDALRGTEQIFAGDNGAAIDTLGRVAEADVTARATSTGLPHDYIGAARALLAAGLAASGDDVAADRALESARSRAAAVEFPVGPFTGGMVEIYGAYVHRIRRDVPGALACAQRVSDIGNEHGFQEYVLIGPILTLAGMAIDDDPDESTLTALQQALDLWQMMGGGLAIPHFYVDLATGFLHAGDLERARQAVDAADAAMDETGQRAPEPESLRVRALLDHGQHGTDPTGALTRALQLAIDRRMARFAAHCVSDLRRCGASPSTVEDAAKIVDAALPSGADASLRAIVGVSAG